MSTVTKHLGDLGRPRDPVDLTFGWFGATIRVAPNASDLDLIEFLEIAAGIDEADKVAAMVATRNYLRSLVDPADFDQFMQLAVANRQQFDDLLDVGKAIVEQVARFPSGRPSDSSDGPPNTTTKSKDGYSSAQRTMAKYAGRPDLKVIVWEANKPPAA